MMHSSKVPPNVTPANAGVQNRLIILWNEQASAAAHARVSGLKQCRD